MAFESPKKEKTRGQWELLQELNQREAELGEKRKKHWITDEEYNSEKAKIDEERLELQTRPE